MNKWIVVIVIVVILAGIGILVNSSSKDTTLFPENTPLQTAAPVSTGQSSSPSAAEEQNMITLISAGFEPATLTIKAGDKVTWVNKSGADATVNSSPHPAHTDYPPLNLGTFSEGGTLVLTFDKVGTYKYHNHLNPGQFGTVVVQ